MWYFGINSLMEYASYGGHYQCVQVLLAAGGSVTATVLCHVMSAINKYMARNERRELINCLKCYMCDGDVKFPINAACDDNDENCFRKHQTYSEKCQALKSIVTHLTSTKSLRWICGTILRKIVAFPRPIKLINFLYPTC